MLCAIWFVIDRLRKFRTNVIIHIGLTQDQLPQDMLLWWIL